MREIYDGLAILLKYDANGMAHSEHDILYAAETKPEDIAIEDLKALDKIGWWYDEDLESWCIFN
jgi:hypothetical protein